MAHGSCEMLVTMDLELMDEHKNTTVRSKPFPASKGDSEEIMRQITECIAADRAEKYEQAEYPKHSSPCFLVDKPGSNAKRLVVLSGKLNKLTKKHSGSLPSLEQALERAAHCRFKSELDKRSGFWQVELTKRAQDLSAFTDPNGQVFKWKVMPFGLTNAPAPFQELRNQVVARMKLKPRVQALLKNGAVIEVYTDDVLLLRRLKLHGIKRQKVPKIHGLKKHQKNHSLACKKSSCFWNCKEIGLRRVILIKESQNVSKSEI